MHNKTRRLAILSLCMALVLSCVIAFVPQTSKATAEETSIVTIDSLDALKAFRDSVNGGNDYKGKTIKLTADIDLGNEEWTPIGTSSATFNGCFDGQNHKISNLFINMSKNYVSGGANENYAGLFGYMKGGNTAGIKNLVLENANVTGCLYVGTILGRSYTGGIIENCHVTGSIKVDSYSYAGGLVGRHEYSQSANVNGVNMSIYNCSVKATNGQGTVHADYAVSYVGGIVGFLAEGDYVVDSCSVENVAITGTYGVGGISGIGHYQNTISNATVNGVTVTSVNNDPTSDRSGNVGLIAGTVQGNDTNGPTTFYGNETVNTTGSVTYTNSTTAPITNESGSSMDGSASVTDNPVAKIGTTLYYDIVTAIKAIKANDTLTLLNNVTYEGNWDNSNQATGKSGKITVPATIDGNGKTLKVIGQITDPNYSSLFRFEADVTVKNLTVDLSEINATRFRAISTKAGLTVDNCEFIGSTAGTNTRAIIFGEGAGTLKSNVSITNSTFSTWTRGITDNENGQDTAPVLVITGNTLNNAAVNVSASESIVFNSNKVDGASVTLNSHTNKDALALEYKQNELSGGSVLDNKLTTSNITTDAAVVYGSELYATTGAFLADVVVDGTLTLAKDVKLNATLTLPENVTVFSNGYVINGSVLAGGTTTFADHAKIASFSVAYTGLTINIPVGGCLEMTGSGRMVIGHNTTFNITGSIVDAKNTDVSTIQPSLIANGASFTGGGVEFNATNAYIKFPASYCSSKGTSGVFNFNIENSIFETAGKLAFDEEQSSKATVNFNLKDSVLTTGGHLVFSPKGVSVIDNSNVNVGKSYQLENCGTLIVKNGSVVNGANASSSNAKMAGTLIVDNATYATTGEFTGSNVGIGTLIAQNGANVTLDKISKTNVYKYSDVTIKVGGKDIEDIKADDVAFAALTAKQVTVTELSYFAFDLAVDKAVVKAEEDVTVTISLDKDAYAVEHTFTYDKDLFTCAADVDGDGSIYANKFEYKASEALATYVLTAKNEITKVVPETTFAVTGNVVEAMELALTGVESIVTADSETIKLSLNYEAEIYADYVPGYSLVLVDGIDAGYAYAGVNMIFVTEYDAFAILVKGTVTPDMVEANLTKANSACKEITKSYDVNCEFVKDGKVDLKDATAVYACSMVDFDVASYMALYLRADVNNDFKVNMIDINAITANYNN